MKLAKGPRPWPIRLFTLLFLSAGLAKFAVAVISLEAMALEFRRIVPGLDWNREAVIIAINARLTIHAIPVILIWFRASNIARWLVAIVAAVGIPGMAMQAIERAELPLFDWHWFASNTAYYVAIILLFAPAAARRWFGRKKTDVSVFE